MMLKPKSEFRFQSINKQQGTIEGLKNRLADNSTSPFLFFLQFFSSHSNMTYLEFLELINYHERVTPDLLSAIRDFERVSV